MTIDYEVIKKSYGWTISTKGELCGLIAGDHGFMPTGIFLDEDSMEVWNAGLEATKDR